MREAFPEVGEAPNGSRPNTVHVDPRLGLDEMRRRWEARSAQWRARELAESIFGGEVEARLVGHGVRSSFRGLLYLDVPFTDLERHRSLEACFLAVAARDPLLSTVPFVFVLGPAAR